MADFEIVARVDFSDVTYLLEVRHPQMAKAAKPGQFVIVMEHEHGERIPLTIADFDRDKGTITLVIQAVGKTTQEMQQRCQVGTRLHAMVGPMGIPSHIGAGEEGGLRRRRPGRGADLPAGARLQGERRLRHRRAGLPQQGPDVLGRQVRRLLRRADRLHRRRLGRHQGPGHRRHQAGHRGACRHRRGRGHRPAGHDEGLRRHDAALRHQDHGQPEPGDGGRHRHVRRLPREDRRQRQVRLRRRPRFRRAPGGLRRPDGAAGPLPADRDRPRCEAWKDSCRIRGGEGHAH